MSIFRLRAERKSLADGLYEDVLSEALGSAVSGLAETGANVDRAPLSLEVSGGHLAALVEHAVRIALDGMSGKDGIEHRVRLVNEILQTVGRHAPGAFTDDELIVRPELLLGIMRQVPVGSVEMPSRPRTPLSRSELFVNARHERGLLPELLSEIASADRVDILVAFLKWSGFNKVRSALESHRRAGKPLRVLTTTYLGASDARAIDELAKLGAEVKVSYEETPTRLHAKAWLFHRNTGLSTAYIGSSNLSRAALTEGLEWNVRIAAADLPHVIERFTSVFRSYFDDPSAGFVPYDASDEQRQRLVDSLRSARRGSISYVGIGQARYEYTPHDFQRAILDALQIARETHARHANLVVAATGTGKTVIAALDYRRLRSKQHDTLLYVAHRKEILDRSRETFRDVLRDPAFGETYYGDDKPTVGRHVFASIQSLAELLKRRPPSAEHFDVVIIDEVHHAAAKTYRDLLDLVRPRELLGLTATPERADDTPGEALQLEHYFPKPWSAELRLWDAIERQILVPFTYFAIDDGTDVRAAWKRGRYKVSELSNVYDANRMWVKSAARAVVRYVQDASSMRAIAFCVDIAHARLVAHELALALDVPCAALTSADSDAVREDSIRRFLSYDEDRPRVLATVDLFNEGVDLPAVDTLLLMRPTESATLFIQQLGRGLRRSDGKDCLTVLDFVGVQHDEFKFYRRYQALTGLGRGELGRALQHGFAKLPAGCAIELEERPRQQVLKSLRTSLGLDLKGLAARLDPRTDGALPLMEYLTREELELQDLYRDKRTYHDVRRVVGVAEGNPVDEREVAALKKVQRLIHVDDPWRLSVLDRLTEAAPFVPKDEREARLARMLLVALVGSEAASNLSDAAARLASHHVLRSELRELLLVLRGESRVLPAAPLRGLPAEVPLHRHGRYRTEEIAAAFDLRSVEGQLYLPQGGVIAIEDTHDLLLVTLDKSDKSKVPHLQYQDYALAPDVFHWQSKANTTRTSKAGRRHLNPAVVPLLFVRTATDDERDLAQPYVCLGSAVLVEEHGERPMSITYRLRDGDMPADLLALARVTVA